MICQHCGIYFLFSPPPHQCISTRAGVRGTTPLPHVSPLLRPASPKVRSVLRSCRQRSTRRDIRSLHRLATIRRWPSTAAHAITSVLLCNTRPRCTSIPWPPLATGSRDSLFLRAPDSRSKGCEFESWQKWRGECSSLWSTLCADSYSVSVPPQCYRIGT